ncbi:MAG TPA: hypothetical protein H9870_13385 [Candidatus Corynebacterium avicola]|uniref:DUF3052 domain-containing protein n=1 Tax=Candidatus Corynebacterium avicola TaxID=2838527 RepID=A0A9D1ULS6_9CORY|nr:hypothetical protein [Candidatus Corynebacterium avicola]
MPTDAALAKKLQIKADTKVWVWPPGTTTEVNDADVTDIAGADVALLFTADRAAVEEVFKAHREDLAGYRAVWIIYAKANSADKTDINRDLLWGQLAEYDWRAVSQVSYSDTLSALRVRPLKDGEPSPVQ